MTPSDRYALRSGAPRAASIGDAAASSGYTNWGQPKAEPLSGEIRSHARFGIVVLVLFFVVGGAWATWAPLSGAVIAPGVVSPDSSRKIVQHLEGGIIGEILVRDGDQVQAGDTLILLDDIAAAALVERLLGRTRTLAAIEARLLAERAGAPAIDFSHPLLADVTDADVVAIRTAEENRFEARRDNDRNREAILQQRIIQLEKQISGLERQMVSAIRQSQLIEEEIVGVNELLEKQLERKPRLLALQRAQAEILGERGELEAGIARGREMIGETELQIIAIQTERAEEIEAELTGTQAELAELAEQIKESEDILRRTAIVAPVAGTIIDLRYKTAGGVIRPGEPILDIVPTEDDLVIDARVSTGDIDDVRGGQAAYVTFPSFPQRNLIRIEGRVRHTSADALEDERTGIGYYTAKVEVDRAHLRAVAPEIELQAGMPAEVFIRTGERTFLNYLLQPFLQTVERSFREK